MRVAAGCTSTAPSGCGRPRHPDGVHLTDGLGAADSWTTDNHKWLNVPYDSGVVLVRDRVAHRAAMTLGAAYYVETDGAERDGYNWAPESSRRARAFAVWAVLRSVGRDGLAERIEQGCRQATLFAALLADEPGVTILNDVVLNQVLVRFEADAADRDPGDPGTAGPRSDALTRDVDRPGPARRDVLGRRNDVARRRRDAAVRVVVEHDR